MAQNMQKRRMRQIFEEVEVERERQIAKGYTTVHDARHTPQDWIRWANQRFTHPLTLEARRSGQWYTRKAFIEAIAVLVAAVEQMDARAERWAHRDNSA